MRVAVAIYLVLCMLIFSAFMSVARSSHYTVVIIGLIFSSITALVVTLYLYNLKRYFS